VIPIILVKRGECSFVKKVRNIERIGGKVGMMEPALVFEFPQC